MPAEGKEYMQGLNVMGREAHADPSLIARLKAAAERELTVAERQAQRVSHIMAGLPAESSLTRIDVEKVLERANG